MRQETISEFRDKRFVDVRLWGEPRDQPGAALIPTKRGVSVPVEYLDELGWDAIRTHERALGQHFLDAIPDHCTLYGLETMDQRVPTFAFRVGGMTPREVAERLAAREIAVWDGDYYAVEAMARLGLQPEGAVRTGFVHYNTFEEVDRLLATLAEL